MRLAPPRWSFARQPFLRHPRLWTVLGALALVALTGVVLLIPLAARLDALRARRATGPSWSFPSRLYTAGVPFLQQAQLGVRPRRGDVVAAIAVPGHFDLVGPVKPRAFAAGPVVPPSTVA